MLKFVQLATRSIQASRNLLILLVVSTDSTSATESKNQSKFCLYIKNDFVRTAVFAAVFLWGFDFFNYRHS